MISYIWLAILVVILIIILEIQISTSEKKIEVLENRIKDLEKK